MAKTHLATASFQAVRQQAFASRQPGPAKGFSVMVSHMTSGSLVLVAVYLWPGLGVRGRSGQVLAALASFLHGLAGPWLL
eukprot:3606271-Pyramimonas_sp.AAC.1